MKITRRMEWPFIDKFESLEEVSEYYRLLYQTLTEESALRAIELDVPYTDGYNVFIGHEAGQSNTISLDDTEGVYNVFLGHQAGYSNTTGYKNIATGYQSLYSNTTGAFNIAYGHEALKANVGGNLNIALGWHALLNATAVSGTVAIGYAAMGLGIVTGTDNIAIGQAALFDMTSGFGNIGVGRNAARNVTTGDQNVAVGKAALDALIVGDQNVAIGDGAGISCLGSGNVFLGRASGESETGSNKLYIANSNTATPLIGGVFPNTSLTFTSAASTFSGNLFIGDTANTKMTLGLTINQGGADNEILAFKSGDIDHDVTGRTEADTFGFFKKSAAADGGVALWGFSKDVVSVQFVACADVDNTAKNVAALAPFEIYAAKESANDVGDVGADGNLAVIRNNGATKFIFDEDGDFYYAGATHAFQDYDDIELLAELEVNLDKSKKLKSKDKYKKKDLEDAKLLRPFLSTKRLNMLTMGSIRQLSERIEALEARL